MLLLGAFWKSGGHHRLSVWYNPFDLAMGSEFLVILTENFTYMLNTTPRSSRCHWLVPYCRCSLPIQSFLWPPKFG